MIDPPFGLHTQLVMLPGQTIRGGAESVTTSTLNEQNAALPAPSVARQFTVWIPTGKKLPEGGMHSMTGTVPQALVAVGDG